jgi:hypothetical protein
LSLGGDAVCVLWFEPKNFGDNAFFQPAAEVFFWENIMVLQGELKGTCKIA